MRFLAVFWVAGCFFLLPLHLFCANTPIFFSFISDDGRYNFEGGFSVEADADVVWSVLTDYNHVSSFVSNMHSRVKKDDGNDLLVEQDAGGGFLIIQEHIKALLAIHEEPFQSISFNDVSHKNFELYSGVWDLQPDTIAGQIKVTYELQATRDKSTPNFLTADLFSNSLGDLLSETQREIYKRQLRKEKNALEEARKMSVVAPTTSVTAYPTAVQGDSQVSKH
jgi:hypothetical protein